MDVMDNQPSGHGSRLSSCRAVAYALISLAMAAVLTGCQQPNSAERFVVAIVDTGISTSVDQFEGFEILQENHDPSAEHGTMVASTLLGVTTDGEQLDRRLIQLISLDVGQNPTANDLAVAIDEAASRQVDLISISMGVRRDAPSLRQAVAAAENRKIPIVAAAGNVRFLESDFPARYESVISVSCVDASGKFWEEAARKKVDTVADCVDLTVVDANGVVREESGTSLAAARISRDIADAVTSGNAPSAADFQLQPPPR